MKKGCSFVIWLIIAIVIISNITTLVLENLWKREELKGIDLQKYNYDINVEYKFNSYKYTVNINSNSVIDVVSIKDIINNYIGYHIGKYNEEYTILDKNDNIVLSYDTIFKKFSNKFFAGIGLIKYNENTESIYFLIEYYSFYDIIVSYNLRTKKMEEIMKISESNGPYSYRFYQLVNNKIYALNEDKELCEYDITTQMIKKLGIKPMYFDVKNNILVYSLGDSDWKNICVYNLIDNRLIKSIKTYGYMECLSIDKSGCFVLTIEKMPGFTSLYENKNLIPLQKNRAVLYEISSGKHKIIKEADKNNLVYSISFVE